MSFMTSSGARAVRFYTALKKTGSSFRPAPAFTAPPHMRPPDSYRAARHYAILSDAELSVFLAVYALILLACAGALLLTFRAMVAPDP